MFFAWVFGELLFGKKQQKLAIKDLHIMNNTSVMKLENKIHCLQVT